MQARFIIVLAAITLGCGSDGLNSSQKGFDPRCRRRGSSC